MQKCDRGEQRESDWSNKGPLHLGVYNTQGHSILSDQSLQGSILSTNEDIGPQGIDPRPTVTAATAISKIQLDNVFKNSLYSFLQHEVPYADILKELLGGTRQVEKNNLIFKLMNGFLFVRN